MKKKYICRFLVSVGLLFLALPNSYYFKYVMSDEKVVASEVTSDLNSFLAVSYNIRCKTFLDIGKKSWFNRANLIISSLKNIAPDLIGLQEVTPEQFKYLNEHLENYSGIIRYRDNMPWSEGCPIFYNTNRYELLETNTFWLSETPNVMSKSWQSANYRICTYIVLHDRLEEQKIAVFNTHLDHESKLAQQKGIELICKKIEEFDDMPIILMGDFNADELSDTYRYALDFLVDTKYETLDSMSAHTYNGWGKYREGTAIDHIMVVKNKVKVDRYWVEVETMGDEYPSDHFPVFTQLQYSE